jgi:hypothetical protein
MNNVSFIFIQIGTGFVGSLLAGLVVYKLTAPSLKSIMATIKDDLKQPLNILTSEVKKITDSINKLVEIEKEKK